MLASERWEAALARWAWPAQIRASAPADPWVLSPADLAVTRRSGPPRPSPASIAAQDALPRRGTVLDVGCGPGAASASLRQSASKITGVDRRPAVLEEFAAATSAKPSVLRRLTGGAPSVSVVDGRWPQIAGEVEIHDVVVCDHVLYDISEDVAGFVAALHDHARAAVVMTLTAKHPLHWLNPYAELLHGVLRPADPDVDLAAEVVRAVIGVTPTIVRWTEQLDEVQDMPAFERMVARRVCVGEDRLDDVGLALHRVPPPAQRAMAALVWPGGA
jgi:SAM-dependent methyltransferase